MSLELEMNWKRILLGIFLFCLGAYLGANNFPVVKIKTETVVKKEYINGDATVIKDTQIAYVPKEIVVYKDSAGKTITEKEKVDLQADLGKTELNVKINGKDAVIKKSDTEKFIFDENKILLSQTSRADINIVVPVLDKTKHWSIGIGVSKNGLAGKIDFPLSKKSNIDGWVYGDKKNYAGGVSLKF